MQTYEWLKHAVARTRTTTGTTTTERGLRRQRAGLLHLVPVITGPQGDYHARGGDARQRRPAAAERHAARRLNTPRHADVRGVGGDARRAGRAAAAISGSMPTSAMIYETAWHEEDQLDYSNTRYGPWNFPDNVVGRREQLGAAAPNHVRQVGLYAAAAAWADSVRGGGTARRRHGRPSPRPRLRRRERVCCSTTTGCSRCSRSTAGAACWPRAFDPLTTGRARLIVGAPLTNPSAPGEEEYSAARSANRCSAFKDMNGGGYADAPYGDRPWPAGWRFRAPTARS